MGSRIGLVAAAAFVLGPVLAWLRVVPGMVGFVLFALGGVVGLVVGVASAVGMVRGRGLGAGAAAAIVVGIVFVAVAARSAGAPRINDFTTDPGDPPSFVHAATLAPNAGRDMSYPRAFAAIQQACCADLRPARLPVPPRDAFTRAQKVAERMPAWTVTHADAEAGTIEAIATSRLFGFHDDIVVRVRPDGDGASRVDMRSKSRNGQGDLGANAARIRTFVGELERPATLVPP
jgi:uncharacterized protein (DUF1499 family)